jgi:hypothetical protein
MGACERILSLQDLGLSWVRFVIWLELHGQTTMVSLQSHVIILTLDVNFAVQ